MLEPMTVRDSQDGMFENYLEIPMFRNFFTGFSVMVRVENVSCRRRFQLRTLTSTPKSKRKPSWRERERTTGGGRGGGAIVAKIYSRPRAQGNYNLPKHYNNNNVLKALCAKVGWVVEDDGTTYRNVPNLPFSSSFHYSQNGRSVQTRCNSFPSMLILFCPIPSCQVSPSSSSFPSPTRADANNLSSLLPFLRSTIPSSLPALEISISALVTPPLSSLISKNFK
ncbi:hypothetical protein Gotur_033812 [Gossypium turneri]